MNRIVALAYVAANSLTFLLDVQVRLYGFSSFYIFYITFLQNDFVNERSYLRCSVKYFLFKSFKFQGVY